MSLGVIGVVGDRLVRLGQPGHGGEVRPQGARPAQRPGGCVRGRYRGLRRRMFVFDAFAFVQSTIFFFVIAALGLQARRLGPRPADS